MGRGGSMPESIISISIPNPHLPQPRCTTTQCLMYITVCRCRWPRPRRTTQRPRYLKRPNGCSWLRRRPWVSMVISRCHCVQAGPTGLRWYSPENGGSPTSKNGWSLASKPHTNQRGTTETGEFTWGLGLNEPHPRGQFNAFLAAAEAAGPGAWEALSAAPLDPCPQIVGVDFPTMAFDRAEWIGSSLYLGLAPLYEDPKRLHHVPYRRRRTSSVGHCWHRWRNGRCPGRWCGRAGAAEEDPDDLHTK